MVNTAALWGLSIRVSSTPSAHSSAYLVPQHVQNRDLQVIGLYALILQIGQVKMTLPKVGSLHLRKELRELFICLRWFVSNSLKNVLYSLKKSFIVLNEKKQPPMVGVENRS